MARAAAGSRLDVGSSRSSAFGPVERARVRARGAAARRPRAGGPAARRDGAATRLRGPARPAPAVPRRSPRHTDRAYSTFACAERRNSTGFWKTKPRRGARARSGRRPAHSTDPRSGANEIGQDPQQHALARTVRPEDRGDAAAREGEVDAVDEVPAGPRHHDAARFDRQHRARRRVARADRPARGGHGLGRPGRSWPRGVLSSGRPWPTPAATASNMRGTPLLPAIPRRAFTAAMGGCGLRSAQSGPRSRAAPLPERSPPP